MFEMDESARWRFLEATKSVRMRTETSKATSLAYTYAQSMTDPCPKDTECGYYSRKPSKRGRSHSSKHSRVTERNSGQGVADIHSTWAKTVPVPLFLVVILAIRSSSRLNLAALRHLPDCHQCLPSRGSPYWPLSYTVLVTDAYQSRLGTALSCGAHVALCCALTVRSALLRDSP